MDGLQALDKSLEIWTAKSKALNFDGAGFGEDDYPLCDLFNQEPGTRPCYRCPVAEATGAAWCDATPLHTVKWFHRIW